MKFADLLAGSSSAVSKQQADAERLFPLFVEANSLMRIWALGDPIPIEGKHLLVGIATYSLPDLRLLDALTSKLSSSVRPDEYVDVFDTSVCKMMADFEKYIAGIGNIYQTPVIGLWEEGELVYKAWGAAAREWCLHRYEIDTF
jgi:hypothetical protein